MQTAHNENGFVSIGINFGVTLLCVYPTWIVLSELKESHEGQENTEFERGEDSERSEEIDVK